MSRRPDPDKIDYVNALEWQIKHFAPLIPLPVREFVFHPKRKWPFDLAWPTLKIASEVDGGVWRRGGGAHTGTGHVRDLRKGNAAVILGWRVLHFLPEDVMSTSGRHSLVAIEDVVDLFHNLGMETNYQASK